MKLAPIYLALFLAACTMQHRGGPAAAKPLPSTSELTSAETAADAAAAKAAELDRARDARVKASVEVAREINQQQPEAVATVVVDGELGLAEGELADVTADPAVKAAAAIRAAQAARKDLATVRRDYAQLASKAEQQATAISDARAAAEQARLERDAARASYTAAVSDFAAKAESARLDYEQRIKAAVDEREKSIAAEQAKVLTWIGAGCVGLTVAALAVGWFAGGLLGLRGAAKFAAWTAVGAVCCFGYAQIVVMWWVKWAVLGTLAVGVTMLAIYLYRRHKAGQLQAAVSTALHDTASTAKTIVQTLDEVREKATPEVKKVLEEQILPRLSAAMDYTEKQVVKKLRLD